MLITARIPLSSTSNSIVKFSALALQLLAECTSFSIAPPARKHSQAHTCVSTSLEMLQIVIEDFARRGVMPMIEDAHSVAVASTAVRLVRFLPYLDLSARAAVRRRLTKSGWPINNAYFSRHCLPRSCSRRSRQPSIVPGSLYPCSCRQSAALSSPVTRTVAQAIDNRRRSSTWGHFDHTRRVVGSRRASSVSRSCAFVRRPARFLGWIPDLGWSDERSTGRGIPDTDGRGTSWRSMAV